MPKLTCGSMLRSLAEEDSFKQGSISGHLYVKRLYGTTEHSFIAINILLRVDPIDVVLLIRVNSNGVTLCDLTGSQTTQKEINIFSFRIF